MENSDKVYEDLAAHLNRLPVGFPRTPTGVEMRILKRLFTLEEARLAQVLTPQLEPVARIAARAGLNAEDLAPRLEEMSRKGLIFRLRKGDEARFMAAQFVIGIWEYHVNDLDVELIKDVNEYLPYFFDSTYRIKIPQLRTIPISKAIVPEQAVMPYDEAKRLISEQRRIVVAPCICRKEHQMMNRGCGRPMESCLVFGAGAVYYEENGIGRPIDQAEAMRILEGAEESGLVLQPSNARKVTNICMCCGCCCQILKNLKKLPKPAAFVASSYHAVLNTQDCTGCETCMERCQMEAIRMDGDTAAIQRDRCIGCGLCVPTCPAEAIRLELKPEAERPSPPEHILETYMKIAQERMGKKRGN